MYLLTKRQKQKEKKTEIDDSVGVHIELFISCGTYISIGIKMGVLIDGYFCFQSSYR